MSTLPKQPTSVPWFNRENYDAVKREAPHDTDLPDTYAEWQEGHAQEIGKLQANRIVFTIIIINACELAAYCRACGQGVNGVTVRAFALKLYVDRRRQPGPT